MCLRRDPADPTATPRSFCFTCYEGDTFQLTAATCTPRSK